MATDNNPSVMCPTVRQMQPELEYVLDVYNGWPTVTKFLSAFAEESAQDFAARKARPNFTDFLGPVVEAVTGKIFREDPTVTPATGRISEIWEDIDRQGNRGPIFLQTLTKNALIAGQSFILVDYPSIEGNPTRGQRLTSGIRSYWTEVQLNQVTNIQFARDGLTQKMILSLFVYKETVEEYSGFKVNQIDQWRVYRNIDGALSYEVWRKDKRGNFALTEGPFPIVGVTELPIVSLNFRPVGRLVSRPVFLELAHQAIDYYLTTSDMAHSHERTSYPTLFLRGMSDRTVDGKPIIVGPGAVISTPNPNAEARYVESAGTGVTLGLQLRDAIRSQMSVLGLSFLEVGTKMAQTAQALAIDESVDNDAIQLFGQAVEDAVNQALIYTAEFEDVPAPTFELAEITPTAINEQIVVTDGETPPEKLPTEE